jgi:DHA1 family bicyclomycin/chloramphenicol resistance-like MFS transporter
LSPTIYVLAFFRLLQGLGAAGSIVIARSVAADLFTGKDLLKFLALIAAVQGIAPIAAPVAGGVLLLFTDWKGIFLCLGLLGLGVFLAAIYLKESHPHHKRAKVPIYSTFKFFVPVLKNKPLMRYIALLSFSMAFMFTYIAASAVLGASTFLVGGIVMPLAGLGNILHSTAYVMTASAVIAMIILCAVNKNQK